MFFTFSDLKHLAPFTSKENKMSKKAIKYVVALTIWKVPVTRDKQPQLTKLQLLDHAESGEVKNLCFAWVDTTKCTNPLELLAEKVFGSQWCYKVVSKNEIGVQPKEFSWIKKAYEIKSEQLSVSNPLTENGY